jgi:hypothetical protein
MAVAAERREEETLALIQLVKETREQPGAADR